MFVENRGWLCDGISPIQLWFWKLESFLCPSMVWLFLIIRTVVWCVSISFTNWLFDSEMEWRTSERRIKSFSFLYSKGSEMNCNLWMESATRFFRSSVSWRWSVLMFSRRDENDEKVLGSGVWVLRGGVCKLVFIWTSHVGMKDGQRDVSCT